MDERDRCVGVLWHVHGSLPKTREESLAAGIESGGWHFEINLEGIDVTVC